MLVIEEAKRYEEDAREERAVTDTDNAAALFRWPGLMVTYIKTNDVIDAATDKQKCLNGFLRRKIVCTSIIYNNNLGQFSSKFSFNLIYKSKNGIRLIIYRNYYCKIIHIRVL